MKYFYVQTRTNFLSTLSNLKAFWTQNFPSLVINDEEEEVFFKRRWLIENS